MIYFDNAGHLTDEAFAALRDNTADELSRLEIAEHLSFCDECVLRYSEFITIEDMETAVSSAEYTPQPEKILSKIRRRVGIILTNRYAMAVLSGAAAIALWVGGVFSADTIGKIGSGFESFTEALDSFSQRAERDDKSDVTWFDDKLSLKEFIENLFNKGDK